MELQQTPTWQAIVRHLQRHRSDSISGIARTLSTDRDRPLHRLTVAGYLQVMSELGMLREVMRPPSIHYQLQDPRRHRTIYEQVAEAVELTKERKNLVACAALQHLFQRPIFLAELHQAGCTEVGLERKAMGDEARRGLRERVQLHAKLDIPVRDPLLWAQAKPAEVQEVLRIVTLEATRSEMLRHEGTRGHQTSLNFAHE